MPIVGRGILGVAKDSAMFCHQAHYSIKQNQKTVGPKGVLSRLVLVRSDYVVHR